MSQFKQMIYSVTLKPGKRALPSAGHLKKYILILNAFFVKVGLATIGVKI